MFGRIRQLNIGISSSESHAISDALTAVLFAVFILSLCVAGVIGGDRAFSPQENRYLAEKPRLQWQMLLDGSYMPAVEVYVTDQFPGRDFWVSFKARCQRWSGQKENNGVYFAAEGYLIGKPLPPDADITDRNLAAALALRAEGYDVALLVSPMAAEMLRDKLPAYAYQPTQAELLAKLRREAPEIFVDVEPSLRQANGDGQESLSRADERQIFFRTDHHWTMAGAYEAYAAYMDWRGEAPLPLSSYDASIISTDFYGTLWSKNSLPDVAPDSIEVYQLPSFADSVVVEFFDGSRSWQSDSLYQAEYLEQKDQYAYFLGQNRPLVVIRQSPNGESVTTFPAIGGVPTFNNATDTQKLLVFKDSYAHCFAPFLLPHFDEIHLADLRYWRQDPLAYMEEHDIHQVLFLYNTDNFSTDRSISMLGAYITGHASDVSNTADARLPISIVAERQAP